MADNSNLQKSEIHIIDASQLSPELNLKDALRNRDLIMMLYKRQMTTTYKQTVFGLTWWFIMPLLSTVVLTVVFGGIAKIPTDGVPSFLFYLSGNIFWVLFSSVLTDCSTTFIKNAGVFGKVYFPRIVAPVATNLYQLTIFAIQFSILVAFFIFFLLTEPTFAPHLGWTLLLLPVILCLSIILATGFGLIIASVTTKYRDLAHLTSFFLQLWMYGTPVVYPLSFCREQNGSSSC